ncbi:MAG TPA: ribbon-helix-helix protein, CopG family [Pirellulales bacterium]|nr:ribbon-helix-helix protein, CopG family [Pirellulales bacterium]
MARINIRVEERLKQELEDEARKRGVSPSEVVREALETHLESLPKRRTCLEIAQQIGLIGCAKGLPADLSTNRNHFEGFGRE